VNTEPKSTRKDAENCSQNYQTLNSLLSLGIFMASQEISHVSAAIYMEVII